MFHPSTSNEETPTSYTKYPLRHRNNNNNNNLNIRASITQHPAHRRRDDHNNDNFNNNNDNHELKHNSLSSLPEVEIFPLSSIHNAQSLVYDSTINSNHNSNSNHKNARYEHLCGRINN
jgi:hypothetical protein